VQVRHGKPAPDLFLFAAERMQTAPENCLVIEDSVAGIAGATAAGMPVLGFHGGSHCREGYWREAAGCRRGPDLRRYAATARADCARRSKGRLVSHRMVEVRRRRRRQIKILAAS